MDSIPRVPSGLLVSTALAALIIRAASAGSSALSLELISGQRRCFYEDLPSHSDVAIAYTVASSSTFSTLSIRITYGTDPHDVVFSGNEISRDATRFRTKEHPDRDLAAYKLCFFEHVRPDSLVVAQAVWYIDVSMKWGAHAKDTGASAATMGKDVGSQQHQLQKILQDAQDELDDVLTNLDAMHAREKLLAEANEELNAKVTIFSIISCAVLIMGSFYQRFHIYKYFKSCRIHYR